MDSSALLGGYLDEPRRAEFERALRADGDWVSGWHTYVEVRRNLARELSSRSRFAALEDFEMDWRRTRKVELDPALCVRAAALAEQTSLRTLDALHLAAADRIGQRGFAFLTADARLGRAARSLGWTVLGA